jgi:serine/threonine protein kinase
MVFAGRYEIIEELGHGGMGKVYKVFDKEIHATVALKLIKPEVAADKNTIERFRNELRIARDISHKNVCRMYDLGREAESYFITMEYVPGEDLKSFIRRARRLDVGTAISIAKQVCEGLGEAHKLGVVHRDLKPGNIMIDKDGNAKVMDFGIARSLRTKGITGPGVVIGTPEYMSPEQVDGKEADERADIYSLSIILYEMVTGTVPFEGDTAFAVGLKHKSEAPEDPKRMNPQIPDDLSCLILKGLEKDREKRYQAAEEVLSELIKIEQRLPTTTKEALKRKLPASREIAVKFRLKKFINVILVSIIALGVILLVFLFIRLPSKHQVLPSHKQLTFTGDANYPAISPDGKYFAFVTTKPESGERILIQDLATESSIEVFNAERCMNLCWTPDSSEITVFAKKGVHYNSYLVPRFGGSPRQIESASYITWSPDGTQFACAHTGATNIVIVNKASGPRKKFELSGTIITPLGIDWSPLGTHLLVLFKNRDEKYSILITNIEGDQQNVAHIDNAPINSAKWSSSGDAIFYFRQSAQSNAMELWMLRFAKETGKPSKEASLILSGIDMDNLSISANGKLLLYSRGYSYSNIWIAKTESMDGNLTVKPVQLTHGTSINMDPSVSPDEQHIAFTKLNGMISNIFIVSGEGYNQIQLTYLNSYNRNPVWSPDGKEIAFISNEGGKYQLWKVSSQGGRPYQFKKTLATPLSKIYWASDQHIFYQKPGNRNFQILDTKTEEEIPLVKDESVGWIFCPIVSPHKKKVAVWWNRKPAPGIWIISLEDHSEKIVKEKGNFDSIVPIRWSSDEKWIYVISVKQEKIEYLMINTENDQIKTLPILPFIIEGKKYFKKIDNKPEVFSIFATKSDVWVIENFDQLIK